jgi:DNA primase
MRRYHSQLECFFDSDEAGQKAALRLLPLALKAGMEVRYLGVGGTAKVDPDVLFLEKGLAAYEELRHKSLGAMAFACRAILPEPLQASPEQKSRAAQAVLEIIATADSEVTRSEFIAEAAGHLRLQPAALQRDFEKVRGRSADAAARTAIRREAADGPAPAPPGPPAVGITPEHHLLMLCLHYDNLGKPLSAALPHDWVDTRHIAGLLLNRFLASFEHGEWPGRDHLDELLETPEERALVASLLFDAPAIDDPVKVAREGLAQLQARMLEPRLRQIELALARGSLDSNTDPTSLLKERSELQRKLRQTPALSVAD